jgi:hypothetical protein
MRRALSTLVGGALALAAACESNPVRPQPRGAISPNQPPSAAAISLGAADDASRNIDTLHMPAPLNIIVDPRFKSGVVGDPEYGVLNYFIRVGDAAIWTGHYLAANAFRYAATGGTQGFADVDRALRGLEELVEVTSKTPDGQTRPARLARFYMPDDWAYKQGVLAHENNAAFFPGMLGTKPHMWLANTSRDQYSGAFFGLGVTYSLVPDEGIRARVSAVVTRLLDYLLSTGWSVVNPDGKVSTTFTGRADQQLSFLQVGRLVNPAKFDATYKSYRSKSASSVGTPIAIECLDTHGSYYKFNLNHINLFNLIRLEEAGSPRTSYLNAYNRLRGCTGSHQNAHFNMIDRGIKGTADATRDANTRKYLELWLDRPRRNFAVDLRGQYASCGTDRACSPIPVDKRVNTDFLWQRSPFSLVGTGDGTIETAAIDYVLPYWMGRYYGVITE